MLQMIIIIIVNWTGFNTNRIFFFFYILSFAYAFILNKLTFLNVCMFIYKQKKINNFPPTPPNFIFKQTIKNTIINVFFL